MKWTGKNAGESKAETRFYFWRRGAHEQARRHMALWLALDDVRDHLRGLDLACKLPPQFKELAERVDAAIRENAFLHLVDE